MKKITIGLLWILFAYQTKAQDMTALVMKLKAKLDLVKDYEADGKMKTDVAFIKAPIGKVKVYYKKPDRFRLKKEGGISLLPKGGVSVNMNTLISTQNFIALSAGENIINGVKTRLVKILPSDENSDIVLTTLYIDEGKLLIIRSITSTKENGTYQVDMQYGAYAGYGLPDKVVFAFNTKDYKLPKGITLEFEDEAKPLSAEQKLRNRKGRVEIVYTNYQINKGLSDQLFKN